MSEWRESKLCVLVDIRVSNVDKKIYSNKKIVQLCNYMDAYTNKYITSNIAFSIGSADLNELQRFSLFRNDVVITKDSETPDDIAVPSVVIENINDLVCGYHLAILRPKMGQIFGPFLMHKLNLPQVRKYFFRIASGSTRYGLTIGGIENVVLSHPPLPHQRKIARILTTADIIIEKTEAAIAKYKAIKQGMMHDLFTSGIDVNTGKLRPAFDDAPELYKESELGMIPKEWEVSYLCDLSENLDGKRVPIKQSDRDKMEGNIPYYGASGIIDYVNDYIFDEPLILLGEDGENVISRNLPLAFKIEGKSWVNNHAHVLKPNKDMSIDFLTELLESLDYKDVISGSAQPKINQNNLSQKSLIKPNIREQKIIVNIIYSINSMIQDEKQVFYKYKKLKQGLMQDLLTGKKEVTLNHEDSKELEV